MTSNSNVEPTPDASAKTPTTSSVATKLIQAAALVAVLVPLGTVAMDATSFTCTYTATGSGGGFATCGGFSGGAGAEGSTTSPFAKYLFDFDGGGTDYGLFLGFQDLEGDITVTVTDSIVSPGTVAPRILGYTCLPLAGGDCVEFDILAPDASSTTWLGLYDLQIAWFADTNTAFPNPTILHAVDGTAGVSSFNQDMCKVFGCVYDPFAGPLPGDGGLSTTGDDFSPYIVAQADAVPEPATMFLVTTGLGGLLYRRRQRRLKAAADQVH